MSKGAVDPDLHYFFKFTIHSSCFVYLRMHVMSVLVTTVD